MPRVTTADNYLLERSRSIWLAACEFGFVFSDFSPSLSEFHFSTTVTFSCGITLLNVIIRNAKGKLHFVIDLTQLLRIQQSTAFKPPNNVHGMYDYERPNVRDLNFYRQESTWVENLFQKLKQSEKFMIAKRHAINTTTKATTNAKQGRDIRLWWCIVIVLMFLVSLSQAL